MRFNDYLNERRSTMSKNFRLPKQMKVKEVQADEKGDVWANKTTKIGNIHGKYKYKIESWFQNNEVIKAKLRKVK